MVESPPATPPSVATRIIVWADVLVAVGLCAAAAWSATVAVRLGADPASPHGGSLQWLGFTVGVSAGAMLLAVA